MIRTQEVLIKSVDSLDIQKINDQSTILQRELTPQQLFALLKRINKQLQHQVSLDVINSLKLFRKQLKSKYSIFLSQQVIDKFIKTSSEAINDASFGFDSIDREIRQTGQQINKKKHYFNKQVAKRRNKQNYEGQKRKKRNFLMDSMHLLKDHSNLDEAFIHQKLSILEDYISQEEMNKIQQVLLKKIQSIDYTKYGAHSQKIKNYTIYDFILQKIFNLIQEDPRNIVIRQRYQKIYKKMKQEMVSIITNQEEVLQFCKKVKMPSVRPTAHTKAPYKVPPKRNFYQLEKDKQDLTSQIQDTIDTAKKAIKQALIKRGRPDFAYELQLSLGNRTSPCILSKKRF